MSNKRDLPKHPIGNTPPDAAGDSIAAAWQIGDVILDLYEVKHIHSTGGMGLVYRVHHKGWNTDLAIKSPRIEFFQTEQHKANFHRECEAWINLSLHPHITSCYYVRDMDGIPHVFAEYVEGGNLREWIRSRRLYEGDSKEAIRRILDIAIQFAWGLHYAHEQGLVHQDVKPANVLISTDGIAKVSDFGLAKAQSANGESTLSNSQHSILVSSGGMTPAYCSPEQAARQKLSRKTDIWSWAVSVLEMFVGDITWHRGDIASAALEAYLEMGPDAVGIPVMPEVLGELLGKCFAWEPNDRPSTMLEISEDLTDIYRQVLGTEYTRLLPKAAESQASDLCNRGISMLDLGKADKAKQYFDKALKLDATHPQATYNRGLMLWRSGKMTDDVLIRQLGESRRNHPENWYVDYLLSQVHLERDDCDSAVTLLRQIISQGGDQSKAKELLDLAHNQALTSRRCLKTFSGHTNGLCSVCLSSDGRYALSASYDKTLKLWDIASGECVRTFEGHTGVIRDVCFSSDGRYALSGGGSWSSRSKGNELKLWEVATGKCLWTVEKGVASLSLSREGRYAVSGGWDEIQLWDLARAHCIQTFEKWVTYEVDDEYVDEEEVGHSGEVTSVYFSKDGQYVLSGGEDETVKLWDVDSGQCLHTLEGHTAEVSSVCLSADGKFALSGSYDYTLRLWDIDSGECLRIFEGHANIVNSICLNAESSFALSANGANTLQLWNVTTGECLRTFEGHTDMVTSVCLRTDGRFALSGSLDNTLKLWEARGNPLWRASWELCRIVSSAVTHAASEKYRRHFEEAIQAIELGDLPSGARALQRARGQVEFSRREESLEAWRGLYRHFPRRSLLGGWEIKTIQGPTDGMTDICLSADGRFALLGCGDKTLKLMEVSSGEYLQTFAGLIFPIWTARRHRRGKFDQSLPR